jgi:hypothetical protein
MAESKKPTILGLRISHGTAVLYKSVVVVHGYQKNRHRWYLTTLLQLQYYRIWEDRVLEIYKEHAENYL